MKIEKLVTFLIIFMLLISFISSRPVRADGGYGIVVTKNGEMYRDAQGNLFPIIVDENGIKLVKLNKYELAPLTALIERDIKESNKKSALPNYILKKYYTSKSFSASSYATLQAIYSYKQRYWKWNNEWLGTHKRYKIGDYGCFLTSSVMMLATYNLTINGNTVNPLNLNKWLGAHNGFDNDDGLKFGAIANFPGTSGIGYFAMLRNKCIMLRTRTSKNLVITIIQHCKEYNTLLQILKYSGRLTHNEISYKGSNNTYIGITFYFNSGV